MAWLQVYKNLYVRIFKIRTCCIGRSVWLSPIHIPGKEIPLQIIRGDYQMKTMNQSYSQRLKKKTLELILLQKHIIDPLHLVLIN